jgi:hypothetical protein
MSILGELAAIDLEKATAALRALWSQLRGETRVPLRADFSPELLKPWLPNIVIVEAVGAPPRFRVRLAGTAAVSFAGRDFTDRFLDDVIPPEHYQATVAPYVHAIESGEPAEDDILRHQFVAPMARTCRCGGWSCRAAAMAHGSTASSSDCFSIGRKAASAPRATPTAW